MRSLSFLALSAAFLLTGGCQALRAEQSATVHPVGAPPELELYGYLDPAHPRAELIERIRERLDDERINNAHWGVLIESLDTGEVWYEQNGRRMFIPASNQKVPTTAAAFLSLGPDFTFTTHLCHTGEVNGNTLEGDLVVFGNGDPTLYERFHDDSRDVFRQWAHLLKEMGIERITGDVIGDDNAWEDSHTGSGWPPVDGVTPWYYAEYGPLQVNENYVDIMIHPPDNPGEPVRLVPNMPSEYYTLVNNLEAVEEGSTSVSLNRPVATNRIYLNGRVVAGSNAFERTATITNPTLYYVTVLKETLEEEGIEVHGAPVDCDDIEGWDHKPEDFPVITAHDSPPLTEILNLVMKRSQNMYAESVLLAMGWKDTGHGSVSSGADVVYREMERFGINRQNMRFRDGSGLSRFNYLSPRAVVAIYRGMLETEHADLWWEAQAIGGVEGTIASRFRNTPGAENIRGKTGTLGSVRSLSGYLTTAGDEKLLFSFLVNGHTTTAGQVDRVIDDILFMLIEEEALEEDVPAGG